MGNHDHLVVQTHSGRLSRLIRHLIGIYTLAFNRRRRRRERPDPTDFSQRGLPAVAFGKYRTCTSPSNCSSWV